MPPKVTQAAGLTSVQKHGYQYCFPAGLYGKLFGQTNYRRQDGLVGFAEIFGQGRVRGTTLRLIIAPLASIQNMTESVLGQI